VDIVGEEKKPDSGMEQKSGLPQITVVHAIIAITILVLAVIFIVNFGFNSDLITPSSAEMSIAKLRLVTPVQTLVQNPVVKPTISFRPETVCSVNQTLCLNSCTNRMTDPDNCGFCGKVCPAYNFTDRKCTSAKCSNPCMSGYYDCNQNPADGCESNLGDNDNCGKCGKDCSSGMRCILHQCIEPGGGPERVTQSPLH
jgi:hypothetical protein